MPRYMTNGFTVPPNGNRERPLAHVHETQIHRVSSLLFLVRSKSGGGTDEIHVLAYMNCRIIFPTSPSTNLCDILS